MASAEEVQAFVENLAENLQARLELPRVYVQVSTHGTWRIEAHLLENGGEGQATAEHVTLEETIVEFEESVQKERDRIVAAMDWSDCIDTEEASKGRLEAIEAQLAARFGLTGDVRAQLRQMDLENKLDEDNLVADWHQEVAWYESCWEDNPSQIEPLETQSH